MAARQAVRNGLVSAVMQAGGLLKDLTMDMAGRRGFWQAIRDNAAQGKTIIFRTRTRRWLHRPHRLNGAGALIRRTCH